jgi:UDP-3-O-[3-hydroxymyristoyl] glucosamine N-acyltransferase
MQPSGRPVRLTLAQLASQCGADVGSDSNVRIDQASPIEQSQRNSIVFAENESFLASALASNAGAILIRADAPPIDRPCLRSRNVRLTWARILEILHPERRPEPGIHPTAQIDPTAQVAESTAIGPFCSVGPGTVIEAGCWLDAGVVVGAGVRIGEDTVLKPHVVIGDRCILGPRNLAQPGAVLGSDGFGLVQDGECFRRIPHIGIVRTGSDVEIGANTTIDRAALGETFIADGVKIDNLVQVGHNVAIGRHTRIAAQTGISGSVRIGEYVVMGGQAGIVDHVVIGARARLSARAGVIGDVPQGELYSDFPARPHRQFLRAAAALHRLPEWMRSVQAWMNSVDRRLASPVAAGDGSALSPESSIAAERER